MAQSRRSVAMGAGRSRTITEGRVRIMVVWRAGRAEGWSMAAQNRKYKLRLPGFSRLGRRSGMGCLGRQHSIPKPDISCRARSERRCDVLFRPSLPSIGMGLVALASDLWEVALGLPPLLLDDPLGAGRYPGTARIIVRLQLNRQRRASSATIASCCLILRAWWSGSGHATPQQTRRLWQQPVPGWTPCGLSRFGRGRDWWAVFHLRIRQRHRARLRTNSDLKPSAFDQSPSH